jgi:hypothetical protein
LGPAIFLLALAIGQAAPASAQVQPSFDTIRVQNGEDASFYQVSVNWSPLVLPLPDGGAWAFFTAQFRVPAPDPESEQQLSNFKVFASRFDPASATWSPAQALPGEISFGPTGAVDAEGTVHLVYTIRANLEPTSFGSLVYIKSTPEGGWTGPTLVAASEDAGHQLSPDLTIDATGGLHVAWQDQRAVSPELRAEDASNADIFVSDLNPDGTWSEPDQVSQRTEEGNNGSRPQILADGERLVMLWSIYSTASDIGLDSATHVEWATRPIAEQDGWSEPQTLIERDDTLIGGRFLDAAASPTGDVAILYGRRTDVENQLFIQRLPSGADSWSEPAMIANGNRGSYPRIALNADGAIYVVYNLADADAAVRVGAIALAPGETVAGREVSLTWGEEGQQGIPAVAVDAFGRAWVIYLHQLPRSPAPTETRVLRGAVLSMEPAEPVQTSLPPVGTPEATPEAEATPAG